MNKQEEKKTPLSGLGEFGMIDHITRWVRLGNSSTIMGVGDDAAVLDYGGNHMVLTTDLLLEGIHFKLGYTPLKHLGYKSVVVNLSDVYAMNAVPKQVTVSLGISGKLFLEDIDELYEGVRLACEHYGVDLIGGDVSASMTGLLISVTATGEARKENLTYRSGAMPGDLICVTGNLGASYLGLQVLEREDRIFLSDPSYRPGLEGYDYVLQRQLRPEARRDVVEWFGLHGLVPHSMIDISDGLSSDLLHVCKASGVGCTIWADRIPVHEASRKVAEEFAMEPETAALNGGEDYELLFTVPAEKLGLISSNPEVVPIGEITARPDEKWLVSSSGRKTAIRAQGWNQIR